MTFEASSEMVFATTPPQPSSNALPMTFAFVPGGPEPMMNGFGRFRPLTVISSVGISASGRLIVPLPDHQCEINDDAQEEGHEAGVIVQAIEEGWIGNGALMDHRANESRRTRRDGED